MVVGLGHSRERVVCAPPGTLGSRDNPSKPRLGWFGYAMFPPENFISKIIFRNTLTRHVTCQYPTVFSLAGAEKASPCGEALRARGWLEGV